MIGLKKKLLVFALVLFMALTLYAGGSNEIPQETLDYLQSQKTTAASQTNFNQSSLLSMISNQKSTGETAVIERNMATLTRLYKQVEENFLYDIDHEAVYNAMATALFEALNDKYSVFVPSENVEHFEEEMDGVFGGIGILFSKPDEYILIEQVYQNTPASNAGLEAKDRITGINGEDISELSSTECSKLMRGEIGTTVVLTILRNETTFDVELKRALISVPAVEYGFISGKIGYIYISNFYSSTTNEVSDALSDMTSKGMESLIIDLRECPGGIVDEALKIADMFISDAELLKTSYKNSSKDVVYWANKTILVDPSVEVVILVDGGTASSAEILSATMKDNNRATIIGSKTFGKGIMQAVASFGNSEYKLTTANYFPPSGYKIHENGLIPDIEVSGVEISEEDMDKYLEFVKSPLISQHIKEYPAYTKENIELFVTLHPEIELDPLIIECVVRNNYLATIPYDERPIADTWFDTALITAIEFLSK